jgi:hypothetical protein
MSTRGNKRGTKTKNLPPPINDGESKREESLSPSALPFQLPTLFFVVKRFPILKNDNSGVFLILEMKHPVKSRCKAQVSCDSLQNVKEGDSLQVVEATMAWNNQTGSYIVLLEADIIDDKDSLPGSSNSKGQDEEGFVSASNFLKRKRPEFSIDEASKKNREGISNNHNMSSSSSKLEEKSIAFQDIDFSRYVFMVCLF